jgi:hypothetical protein
MPALPNYDPQAASESTEVEFKSQFDPGSRQDWCEIVKDIVAIANSGGGYIIFGVEDNGTPSGAALEPIFRLDSAYLTDKVYSYTQFDLSDIQLLQAERQGSRVAILRIAGLRFPIVFTSPGTYTTETGSQKTAFSKGTTYFRHGAKSEPGTTQDLRLSLERELANVKDFWLEGIARIVEAPPGSIVQVVTQVANAGEEKVTSIRLTADAQAPAFRPLQIDALYPYRQKELTARLAERIGSNVATPYDIQCVRRVHATDTNPTFAHKPKWSAGKYSEAFIDWLVDMYAQDAQFFQKARTQSRGGQTGTTSIRSADAQS